MGSPKKEKSTSKGLLSSMKKAKRNPSQPHGSPGKADEVDPKSIKQKILDAQNMASPMQSPDIDKPTKQTSRPKQRGKGGGSDANAQKIKALKVD